MVINAEGQKWVHFWGSWQGTLAANDQILSIPVHLAINFVDGKNVMEFGFWDTAPLVNAFAELAEAESAEAAVEE